MKVFLSYAREDAAFVQRLSADLEARAIDVWLDTDDLPTTDEDRWRRSIVQGIRESAALVVVLSPDSVSSGAVEREVTIAAEITRRIIPLVHRPCELPDGFVFELAGVQRVDFVDQPYEQALEQLMRRIGTAAQVTVLPPPTDTPTDDDQVLSVDPQVDEEPQHATIESAPDEIAPALTPEPGTQEDVTGPAESELSSAPTVATPDQNGVDLVAVSLDDGSGERRGRLTLVHVALGVGLLIAAVVVGLMLVSGDQDPDGVSASSPSVETSTEPTSETTEHATATTSLPPGARTESTPTAPETPAPDTTSPAPTSTTAQMTPASTPTTSAPTSTSPPTDPPVVTGETAAVALVDQLLQAYVKRDWDAVRYMNSKHTLSSDEDLFRGYGTADGFPRLESQSRHVFRVEQTGPSQWQVVGTLFAWDYGASGEQTTNIACINWDVDIEAGTATQSSFTGSDGKPSRRYREGWLPNTEFEAYANEFCGV